MLLSGWTGNIPVDQPEMMGEAWSSFQADENELNKCIIKVLHNLLNFTLNSDQFYFCTFFNGHKM